MGKVSTVEIKGHQYRYEYDEGTQKTLYRGPVGDAPSLSEMEFSKLFPADEIQPLVMKYLEGEQNEEIEHDFEGNMLGSEIGSKIGLEKIVHTTGVTRMGEHHYDDDPHKFYLPSVARLGEKGVKMWWLAEAEDEWGIDRDVMLERIKATLPSIEKIDAEIPVTEQTDYDGASVSLYGDRYTGDWNEPRYVEDDNPQNTFHTFTLLPPFTIEKRTEDVEQATEEQKRTWSEKFGESYPERAKTRTFHVLKWAGVK